MTKVFLVISDSTWDGENSADYWVYANEEDAKERLKYEADCARPDWVNECVSEDDHSFLAWREGESCYYHLHIYIDEKELL